MQEFLSAASLRLGLESKARVIFDANGQQVDDLLFVNEGDLVFLSIGEAYCRPSASAAGTNAITMINRGAGLGPIVGGDGMRPLSSSSSSAPASTSSGRRRHRSDTSTRVCGDYVLGDVLGRVCF